MKKKRDTKENGGKKEEIKMFKRSKKIERRKENMEKMMMHLIE